MKFLALAGLTTRKMRRAGGKLFNSVQVFNQGEILSVWEPIKPLLRQPVDGYKPRHEPSNCAALGIYIQIFLSSYLCTIYHAFICLLPYPLPNSSCYYAG